MHCVRCVRCEHWRAFSNLIISDRCPWMKIRPAPPTRCCKQRADAVLLQCGLDLFKHTRDRKCHESYYYSRQHSLTTTHSTRKRMKHTPGSALLSRFPNHISNVCIWPLLTGFAQLVTVPHSTCHPWRTRRLISSRVAVQRPPFTCIKGRLEAHLRLIGRPCKAFFYAWPCSARLVP